MIVDYKTITACRLCGSLELIDLFSLGDQFVSDFVEPGKERAGVSCPIELVLCGHCSLVQQRHTAPQDFLYSRHYWYTSGTTQTMRDALADVARTTERMVKLQPGDVVLDIGSNDGTLLRSYRVGSGVVRIGVEPADNLVLVGSEGIDYLYHDFWKWEPFCTVMQRSPLVAPRGWFKGAKVITACGCFYDIDDPCTFVGDIAKALAPDGLFIAQLMCLKGMMLLGDVGNLVHEHLEFYGLKSLQYLFGKCGLELFDVDTNAVNGESYRLYVRHKGSKVGEEDGIGFRELRRAERLKAALTWEEEHLHNLALRRAFDGWRKNRDEAANFIKALSYLGKRVWWYGASTKSSVITQWLDLPAGTIEAAADVSPDKIGKVMVGSGVPIRSCEDFRAAKPDWAVVGPFAFRAEFIEREREWLEGGGRFLFLTPKLEVYP